MHLLSSLLLLLTILGTLVVPTYAVAELSSARSRDGIIVAREGIAGDLLDTRNDGAAGTLHRHLYQFQENWDEFRRAAKRSLVLSTFEENKADTIATSQATIIDANERIPTIGMNGRLAKRSTVLSTHKRSRSLAIAVPVVPMKRVRSIKGFERMSISQRGEFKMLGQGEIIRA